MVITAPDREALAASSTPKPTCKPGSSLARAAGKDGKKRGVQKKPSLCQAPTALPCFREQYYYFFFYGKALGPSAEARGIHRPLGWVPTHPPLGVGTYEMHPKPDATPGCGARCGVQAADALVGGWVRRVHAMGFNH